MAPLRYATLRYATLQDLIPSSPWIAPGWRAWGRKFGHLATLPRPLMAGATNGVGKSAERKEGRKEPLFSGKKINGSVPPSLPSEDDDDDLLSAV